eukprot:352498-Chlamydomonas_euryale.AAC.10
MPQYHASKANLTHPHPVKKHWTAAWEQVIRPGTGHLPGNRSSAREQVIRCLLTSRQFTFICTSKQDATPCNSDPDFLTLHIQTGQHFQAPCCTCIKLGNMTACVVCYDKADASALFSCPRDRCEMLTCKECAELMITTGNVRCSCGEDVIAAMADFFMDPLSKALAGMQLEQEVEASAMHNSQDVRVDQKLADAEKKRRVDEEKLQDLNGEAARLANLFQESMVDRCPFCEVPFDSYDACNSVTCVVCRNHFCGLCLTKGSCDVHGHSYGGYREALESRVKDKFAVFVKKCFAGCTNSQLYRLFANRLASLGVKPAIDAGGQATVGTQPSSEQDGLSVRGFIQSCRADIEKRLQEERKSLRVGGRIRSDCQLSERFRVTLEPASPDEGHTLNIEEMTYDANGNQRLRSMRISDLPEDDDEAVLIKSIRTAVVAGSDGSLYQTKRATHGINLYPLNADGCVGQRVCSQDHVWVQGILGNARHVEMQEYLARLSPESLPKPVKTLLGAERNAALLTQIAAPPQPFCETLNEFQQPVVDMTRLSNVKVGGTR